MEKSIDVEYMTQNFTGQTFSPTNTIPDCMRYKKNYNL